MPRPLSAPEIVAFFEATLYLDAGIPVYGSRVALWAENGNMPVLIYHTKDYGYALTDISDLGASVINELATQSEIHGIWYYLPQSIQSVVTERAEDIANVAASAGNTAEEIIEKVATTTGNTLYDLLAPVVDALTVPLILIGVLLGIYLFKKG